MLLFGVASVMGFGRGYRQYKWSLCLWRDWRGYGGFWSAIGVAFKRVFLGLFYLVAWPFYLWRYLRDGRGVRPTQEYRYSLLQYE